MPLTPTPHLGLTRTADNETDWGDDYRSNLDVIDAAYSELALAPPAAFVYRTDYGVATDDTPLYFGKARPGVTENAPGWSVTRFYYDAEGRLDRTEVRTGLAWTNRTTPTPSWP